MISLVKSILLSTIKHSDLIQRKRQHFATNMSNFPEEKCLGLKNGVGELFCQFLSNENASEILKESSITDCLSHPGFSFLEVHRNFSTVTEDLGSYQRQYALKLKYQRVFTLSFCNDWGLNVWFRYFTLRVLCIVVVQVSER